MGIYLADQVFVFVSSLLVGAALGLLYDIFRITRIAFPTAPAVVFIEDVLFFLICALVTFFYGLTVIDGMLRVFLILGELLGGIIYFCTIGQLVMRVSKTIIKAVEAVIRFIFRWIMRPIWLLIYHIITFLLRPFMFLRRIMKKKLQKIKFCLKVRRKVLYNQLRGYLSGKKVRNKKPQGAQK